MKKKDEEIEILDFEDNKPSLDDTVEMLDFEADKKVSNEIDEMLDFLDIAPKNDGENKASELIEKISEDKERTKIELDADKEKLEEYTPSIKDFNIKNAKVRKYVKKGMLYVIIVMLLGFEFFINKTGDTLNNLVVYASDNEPIKIEQNAKYGYIDYMGDKIVNPKYLYGEDFIKGYAIVKNGSDIPLIINKGGKEVVKAGEYFSLYRANSDIIASKITKNGLKYGILDSKLKEKTPFKYDVISFKNGVYSYVLGNDVGLINEDGKKIYTYKLTDRDDKGIDVTPSSVTSGDYQRYGVVKVNKTSLIVNLKDGKVVSSPTLNEIIPEENNVFYEVIASGSKRYMYVEDNKILFESETYNSLSIPSIKTGILKAINNSFTYEYISTKTQNEIKKGLSDNDSFYGDSIFMYTDYDAKKRANTINLVKEGAIFKTISLDFEVYKPYKNGFAIIKYKDGTYGYLDENGDLLNDTHYIEAGEFDSYGDAIAKTENGYGVINKNGKTIISFENSEIKMASSSVKLKSLSNRNNVFYAVSKENGYRLYNSKGKKFDNTIYNDIVFNDNYPILKLSTDENDVLMTTEDKNKINLTSFSMDYEAYENYIIVKNEYYNYKGKLIYTKAESKGD